MEQVRAGHGERGGSLVEYLALLGVLGLLVAGIAATDLGSGLGGGIRDAVCRVLTGAACGDGDGDGPPGGDDPGDPGDDPSGEPLDPREQALLDAEEARREFVEEQGGQIAELDAAARAAREAGDYDTAERLAQQIALYQDLIAAGVNGPHVDALLTASDAEFADLVAQGDIYFGDDAFNTRYFQLEPPPGGGVVVMDYFIAAGSSGGLLEGDDRGHADPLRGDVPLDQSRIMVVVDLETGRGQILQSQSCTTSVGGSFCNEPRPIALDGEAFVNDPDHDVTGEGINIDQTNQYDIAVTADGFTLDYDALNSVTPLVISVDGSIEVATSDGGLDVVDEDRDDYPSIGTYYYEVPGETQVVDQQDEEGVFCGALPVNIC